MVKINEVAGSRCAGSTGTVVERVEGGLCPTVDVLYL